MQVITSRRSRLTLREPQRDGRIDTLMRIEPSRISSGCCLLQLGLAVFGGLFLYAVFGPDDSIFDDPEHYWSPYSGRPAIAVILGLCLAGFGGGTLLTWLLTPRLP